jgi:hypothetical protein
MEVRDHQALLDLPVLMAHLAPPVQVACQEQVELLGRVEHMEPREHREPVGVPVPTDLRVRQEQMDSLEVQAPRAVQEHQEQPALMAPVGLQVPMVHQALLALKVLLDHLAPLAHHLLVVGQLYSIILNPVKRLQLESENNILFLETLKMKAKSYWELSRNYAFRAMFRIPLIIYRKTLEAIYYQGNWSLSLL